jgi:hypothetical protein
MQKQTGRFGRLCPKLWAVWFGRPSYNETVPGARKKEQQRAEKRKRREERWEEEWAKIKRKEEKRRNKLARRKDKRRAKKAEREREAAKKKENERRFVDIIREEEELYEERENRWKGLDAERAELEADVRILELLTPSAYIQLTVRGPLFKLLYRLGVFDRGMAVVPKWTWEYRKMTLDALRKILGRARTVLTTGRESLGEDWQYLEELRGLFKKMIAANERWEEVVGRADEWDARADERDRELDEAYRRKYELDRKIYQERRTRYEQARSIGRVQRISGNEPKRHLPIECAPALGSEAMPRTERESAQNNSINAEKTDSEAGSSDEPGMVEWLLVDKVLAGSGEAPYDWTNLQVPQGLSRRGWLLAGGLDPTNVAAALGAAKPDGVDVSSGVVGPDKIEMDKAKVEVFIQTVKSSAAFYPDVEGSSTD